ncbi:hypothetical protein [Alcaligenes sp. SDU_A2]|uniref:hypothetical protein n=1 Tax=Alcaligenes sp. SDU_A2 TaxID=3136634 RepID=UPI00311DABD5
MTRLHSTQKGVALVWGLAVMSALSAAWLGYFHVNQIAEQQGRLSLVLDAAAYSAATEQARTLNLLAYINRAQLGHQLALAHLLTLATWDRAAQTQSAQMRRGNPPAYLIAMMFGSGHGAAYTGARSAGDQQQALEGAFDQHQQLVHQVLVKAQEQLVLGLAQRRRAIIDTVLQASLPDWPASSLSWHLESDDWPDFLRRRSGEQQWRPALRTLVGLYGFLAPREYVADSLWPVDRRCPLWRHKLRRTGRTSLDAQGRWQSDDTQSLHALRSNRWLGCYFREYAMAWALQSPEGTTGIQAPPDFSGQDFWRWALEQGNGSLFSAGDNTVAKAWGRRDAMRWPQAGLPQGYAIVQPQSRLALRLGLQGQGHLGQVVHAVSAAQVFFSVPASPIADAPVRPSLFQPFWQARLIDPSRLGDRS